MGYIYIERERECNGDIWPLVKNLVPEVPQNSWFMDVYSPIHMVIISLTHPILGIASSNQSNIMVYIYNIHIYIIELYIYIYIYIFIRISIYILHINIGDIFQYPCQGWCQECPFRTNKGRGLVSYGTYGSRYRWANHYTTGYDRVLCKTTRCQK